LNQNDLFINSNLFFDFNDQKYIKKNKISSDAYLTIAFSEFSI